MNQLAVEDRYLHRMATKAAKAMQTRVSKEPDFAGAAINGLMGSAGSIAFDQVTKTKTVEKIVTEANSDGLKQIVPLFEKLIAQPGTTDDKAAATSRQSLAGLLLAIVRARASSQESDDGVQSVLEQILSIFVRFAYFTTKDEKQSVQPALTEQTQELFRSRINSCLNSVIANQTYAATLPYSVIHKIRDAAKSEEFGKFIINLGDPVQESVKAAFKSLKKLSSSVSRSSSVWSTILTIPGEERQDAWHWSVQATLLHDRLASVQRRRRRCINAGRARVLLFEIPRQGIQEGRDFRCVRRARGDPAQFRIQAVTAVPSNE